MLNTIALLLAIAGGNFTPAQRAWINGLTPERVNWLMEMDRAYNGSPHARHRDEIVVMAMTLTSGLKHDRPRDFLENPEIAPGQPISVWFQARTLREYETPPHVSVSWYHEDGETPFPGCTSLHVFERGEDPIRDFSTCRPDIPGNWRVVVVYGMRLLDYRTFRVRAL